MYQSVFGEFESEKAEQFYLASLRRMTLEQRWQTVASLRQIAVEMVRAAVQAEHADWPVRQVQLETTRRVLEAHDITFRPITRFPERH